MIISKKRREEKRVEYYLIEIVEALLQTPQTTDTSFQHTASARILLINNR